MRAFRELGVPLPEKPPVMPIWGLDGKLPLFDEPSARQEPADFEAKLERRP